MKGKDAKELHSMGLQLQETGKAMCQMAYAMDPSMGEGEEMDMESDDSYGSEEMEMDDDKAKRVKLAMIRLKKA